MNKKVKTLLIYLLVFIVFFLLFRNYFKHMGEIRSISISSKENLLAVWSDSIEIWGLEKEKFLSRIKFRRPRSEEQLCISPNGRLLAVGEVQSIKIFEKKGKRWIAYKAWKTYPGSWLTSISFSRDGKFLASGSVYRDEGLIQVWDPDTGNLIKTFKCEGKLFYLCFSPTHDIIASAEELEGANDVVRIWDVSTGKLVKLKKMPHLSLFYVSQPLSFSPDGRKVAIVSAFDTITVWDISTEKTSKIQRTQDMRFSSVAFSSDGKLMGAGGNVTINLWDANTGELLKKFHAETRRNFLVNIIDKVVFLPHTTIITTDFIGFSSDSQKIIGAGNGGFIIWDISSGKELKNVLFFENIF